MKVFETIQRFGGPIPQHQAEEMGISNGTKLYVVSKEELLIFLYRVRAHLANGTELPLRQGLLEQIERMLEEDIKTRSFS